MGPVRLGVGTQWLLDGRVWRVVRQLAENDIWLLSCEQAIDTRTLAGETFLRIMAHLHEVNVRATFERAQAGTRTTPGRKAIVTPERALAAVERFGGTRPAARELSSRGTPVSPATISRRAQQGRENRTAGIHEAAREDKSNKRTRVGR